MDGVTWPVFIDLPGFFVLHSLKKEIHNYPYVCIYTYIHTHIHMYIYIERERGRERARERDLHSIDLYKQV